MVKKNEEKKIGAIWLSSSSPLSLSQNVFKILVKRQNDASVSLSLQNDLDYAPPLSFSLLHVAFKLLIV